MGARVGVSNHHPHDCLLNHLFRHRSKKTSKLRVTGLCAWPVNSPHKWPVTRKMFPFCDVNMWDWTTGVTRAMCRPIKPDKGRDFWSWQILKITITNKNLLGVCICLDKQWNSVEWVFWGLFVRRHVNLRPPGRSNGTKYGVFPPPRPTW